MSEQSGTSDSATTADVLQLERHAILSTALPFPNLDWTYQDKDAENLARVRDYSESLANSVLDWYLSHQRTKKRWAQIIHYVMYSLVGLASIPPLVKVGFSGASQSACEFCDWLSGHSGELALFFLGLAGVAKLWDSNGGYTVDWMRFITTAARINQELGQFQFDWEKIELDTRIRPDQAALPPKDGTSSTDPPAERPTPTERKLRLAQEFCAKICKTVDDEIAVWANELKKRYDKVSGHAAQDK